MLLENRLVKVDFMHTKDEELKQPGDNSGSALARGLTVSIGRSQNMSNKRREPSSLRANMHECAPVRAWY